MSELYAESLSCERFKLSAILSVTTKSLFESFTDTMPPPKVELKYPERDFRLTWQRINNPVIDKHARTTLYLLIHERYGTRERGFRLMPTHYITPLCRNCHVDIEFPSHLFASCDWVKEAWKKLRSILENLDMNIAHISDENLLHLNFHHSLRESAILWLMGIYIEYVDNELIANKRKLSSRTFLGRAQAKLFECQYRAMPSLGHISGLTPTGIG